MRLSIFIAVALCTALPALAADQPSPGQQPQTFEKQVSVKLNYLLYLPADYGKDADKKWPLIVFLHGSGESANVKNDDVNAVKTHGPPKLLAANTELGVKNFIVVSPQCPSNRAGWQVYMLNPFLDEIMAKYKVDADHVYLTGLSMGGYGTWEWAMATPNRFAAIAPMSGGGNSNARRVARSLKNMPIWNFHGEADPTVPIAESEAMIDAVKKAGNTDVQFTRYPGVGHNCWDLAYGNAELYDWFLKHTRQPMPQGRGR
ncbi:MAG TPA: prolyl oligopeptidase family serine peptidase [Tepidisphaeraceae bacterium]|jgi:predicted peptidase